MYIYSSVISSLTQASMLSKMQKWVIKDPCKSKRLLEIGIKDAVVLNSKAIYCSMYMFANEQGVQCCLMFKIGLQKC